MLGILCGLKSEARLADHIPHVIVGCSAARPEKAHEMVKRLIEQGAERLISFGLAGATSPDLEAGDLVLGASVMAADGAWEADAEWNDRLLQSTRLRSLCAPVWGSRRIVVTLEEKEAIYRRSGCMIVDMESHIVAEAATKAGLPFNIVRAIADTADIVLPPAALVPLHDDGCVDMKSVWHSIVNQPSQLPDLIALAHNTSQANRALKRAVAIIKEVEDERLRNGSL